MRIDSVWWAFLVALALLVLTGCPPKGTVTLLWDAGAVDASHGPSTDYLVFRGTVAGGPYAQIGKTGVPSYTDSTPAHGVNYYVVVAENASGSSEYSNETAATVP